MRVLVAWEFSGVVRDAFLARGHDAVSCDLLPSERPGPHIVGDVRDILHRGWDLMIAHSPCTFLANSGALPLNSPPKCAPHVRPCKGIGPGGLLPKTSCRQSG